VAYFLLGRKETALEPQAIKGRKQSVKKEGRKKQDNRWQLNWGKKWDEGLWSLNATRKKIKRIKQLEMGRL